MDLPGITQEVVLAFILSKLSDLLGLLLILFLGWLGLRVVRLARARLQRRIDHLSTLADQPGRQRRLSTILAVGAHAANVTIIILVLISLLSKLGVNVMPLLTSLGVVGLAFSLGAQTLVKDYIYGLILLVENQYAVGEKVTIAGFTGDVERITMRATWLRGENGALSAIPHGEVRSVTNITRDWSLVEVSFNLGREADLDRAVDTTQLAVRRAMEVGDLAAALLTEPNIQVWKSGDGEPAQIRVTVQTSAQAGVRQQVEQAIQRSSSEALEQAGLLEPQD